MSETCGHAVAKFKFGYTRSGVLCPRWAGLPRVVHATAFRLDQ